MAKWQNGTRSLGISEIYILPHLLSRPCLRRQQHPYGPVMTVSHTQFLKYRRVGGGWRLTLDTGGVDVGVDVDVDVGVEVDDALVVVVAVVEIAEVTEGATVGEIMAKSRGSSAAGAGGGESEYIYI